MTPRKQLLSVYMGGRTDSVPALADLSYWYAGNGGGKFIPGRTDGANRDKVEALLTLHRRTGAAIHVNLGSFYREIHGPTVQFTSGDQLPPDGDLMRVTRMVEAAARATF